jgi:hypothetical protein
MTGHFVSEFFTFRRRGADKKAYCDGSCWLQQWEVVL